MDRHDAFSRSLRAFALGCNSVDVHVYRPHHRCMNPARFWIPELGMRFCQYHLGDLLFQLDLESYTLHRLEW